MLSWFRKEKDILILSINGQEHLKIKKKELPLEKEFLVSLAENSEIVLKHSLGEVRYTNFHVAGNAIFTVAVHSHFACQIDCIVIKDKDVIKFDLKDFGVFGIRFQPFYLPQNEDMFHKNWKGLGLYQRGLHYQGFMTPKNVYLCAICDDCRKNFLFESIHTGIIESQYMYSNSGMYTFLTSSREEMSKEPLPVAPDNSEFKKLNSFRCPHCASEYIKFTTAEEKGFEHYANFHYGFEMKLD